MGNWKWDAPTGETIGRPELYRRCATHCAQGVGRGRQLVDPVRTAAALVMHDDAQFDLAPTVSAALDPFYDAYPLRHYDEAIAVHTLLMVADRLEAMAAAELPGAS